MPFMDGYVATKKIIQLYKRMDIEEESQAQIVGITGHVEKEYVAKAIESGMKKVHKKPLKL